MLVVVDIDDVLADLVPALARFHNDKYGTELKKEDFFSYHFERVLGCSLGKAIMKVRNFLKSPYFSQMIPIEGSVEGVRELAREHKLVSITSRWKNLEMMTREWIMDYFPDISEIYFAHNIYANFRNNKSKKTYCLELGVNVLIEDSLEYARDCGNNGIEVLLLDQPWNREETPGNVTRVRNWGEIIEYFK